MITNVSLVTVWVDDQDAAKAFYLDVLGFQEGTDITMGDGYRWLTVCRPDHPELHLVLQVPGPPLDEESADAMRRIMGKGHLGGLGLTTDDCRETVDELKAKGVDVIQEPSDRPYGIEAVVRDNSGNWLVLVEQRPFDPEGSVPPA